MANRARPAAPLLAALSVVLASSSCFVQAEGDAAPVQGGFRRIAPGIERTINPASQEEEKFSRHDLVGLLRLDPAFGERKRLKPAQGEPPMTMNLAKNVRLQHDIWALEFTFKPVRFIEVDVPDAAGRVERKLVWYLVYHVKNLGEKPVRFTPRFVLHAHDPNKYYDDRVMPLAVPAIQLREDPRRRLLNSVEISDVEIPPSPEGEDNSVWGVATWRDIDPRTDRFSIFVQGLTNAYRIEEVKGEDPQAPGVWKFTRKTLQLNFWRPSDEYYEHETEIRLGLPGDVDYRWVYK